jgi:hypothetical protein
MVHVMIAALYVQTGGTYYGLDGVDPWDETRDARLYDGPHPVVAHPPCSRWCQLASINEKRWGAMIGDDAGTFAAALDAVRTFGGVLEHPAYSLAWYRYHLPVPTRHGWAMSLTDPGMSTEVSQVAYGHDARKRTWLYAVGVDPSVVDLDWREPPARFRIGAGVHSGDHIGRRMTGDTLTTPTRFRDALLDLARSVS